MIFNEALKNYPVSLNTIERGEEEGYIQSVKAIHVSKKKCKLDIFSIIGEEFIAKSCESIISINL